MTDLSADPPPRSAHAPAGPPAAQVSRGRQAQPNGWWGMTLFLCSEAVVFGTMMSSYFYLNFGARHWPPDGIKAPGVTAPALATAALIATAPLLALAVRAARAGRRWPTVRWIGVAVVIQCAYLGVQVVLFRDDLMHFTPQGSAYGSIYFTLLAAHHAHVLLGILLGLAVMWKLSTAGLDNYWLIGTRGLALYWYVVSGLAVLVLLTVLSPSL
ncbi:MAG: cytochrome c oxidase subunit 3 [Solirubrobacteraceae bacterium]